jgi:hypothetical protein
MELSTRKGMSQHFTIDRFEDGGLVVLEDGTGQTVSLPREWLPDGISEGDVILVTVRADAGVASVRLQLDAEATRNRRDEMSALRESLPRGPEGDLEL